MMIKPGGEHLTVIKTVLIAVNGHHSLRTQERVSTGLFVPKWVHLQRSNTGLTKIRGKVGQGAEDFAGWGAGEGQHKEQRLPDTDAFPFL